MIREFKAGNLNVKIFATREELGQNAAADAAKAIGKVLLEKGYCNIIFAAAPSQNEFLASLCNQDIDWSKCRAFHMDEYIGLTPEAPQGFGNFLKRGIFNNLPFGEVHLISDVTGDPETIAKSYENLLSQFPPDVVCMGIGENGHIAFNDPHVARFDDPRMVKVVTLDEKCRRQQVNDGCFDSIDSVPTHAITLTVPVFMASNYNFCMVPGELKAEAVQKTVTGEVRETLPASILRMHKNSILYLDKDSAKQI